MANLNKLTECLCSKSPEEIKCQFSPSGSSELWLIKWSYNKLALPGIVILLPSPPPPFLVSSIHSAANRVPTKVLKMNSSRDDSPAPMLLWQSLFFLKTWHSWGCQHSINVTTTHLFQGGKLPLVGRTARNCFNNSGHHQTGCRQVKWTS